jgi:hypothetical protein
MKKTLPLWITIGVLSIALIGMGLKFMVLGNTVEAEDGRTAVVLSHGERNVILGEMRGLLEATQGVVEGLAQDDLKAVAEAAEEVGSKAIQTMDFKLAAKLPLDFKQLGFATHYAFDDIAKMAKEGVPTKTIQNKLAETMNNCIACHASFQLPVQKASK